MDLEEMCRDSLYLAMRSELLPIENAGFLSQVRYDNELQKKYENLTSNEYAKNIVESLAKRDFFYYQESKRAVEELQELQLHTNSKEQYISLLNKSEHLLEVCNEVETAIQPRMECKKIITSCKDILEQYREDEEIKYQEKKKRRKQTLKRIQSFFNYARNKHTSFDKETYVGHITKATSLIVILAAAYSIANYEEPIKHKRLSKIIQEDIVHTATKPIYEKPRELLQPVAIYSSPLRMYKDSIQPTQIDITPKKTYTKKELRKLKRKLR